MTRIGPPGAYDPFADFRRGDLSPLVVLYQVEHGRWSDAQSRGRGLTAGQVERYVDGGLLLADPETGALRLTDQGRHLLATTKDYDAGGPDGALVD